MPENRDVSGCPPGTPTEAGDERWAHFRFSVIGPLLAAPPERGELREELQRLAAKQWRHPITGQGVSLGASTIERWYYKALKQPRDPVGVLARKIREDHGSHPSLSLELRGELLSQYRQHPNWTYQLHADNLAALAEANLKLGQVPSYPSIRRFMKAHGLLKRRRRGRGHNRHLLGHQVPTGARSTVYWRRDLSDLSSACLPAQ